ncbi:MAG: diguanylate cyclase domain-containing protein [Gammaproteobacteria bacterium]
MIKTKSFWIYSLVIAAWAAVATITSALVFKLVLQEAQTDFSQRADQLYENIDHIARDNEAILEGFSAFLSAIEYADRDSATRYAKQILARYPHVYRLEVVLIVERKELRTFISRQRQTWDPGFEIKTLDHQAKPVPWRPIENKPVYCPIIFIEPMTTNNRELIGVDLDSLPILKDAMTLSNQHQTSSATIPFNLVNGPRGYGLIRPVPAPRKKTFAKRKPAFVLLEINAESIRNQIAYLTGNIELSLYHENHTGTGPDGMLFHIDAPMSDTLRAQFLPKLTTVRKLNRRGQPFAIKADKQLNWSDIDLPLVITTACTSVLSLAFLLLFLSSHFRREEQRKKNADRLLHMATHDALTGLPNRTLLADRFGQACSRSQRSEFSFSMMFIDLNGFKTVNDTYGHEMGDQLLKAMGSLLKECIREEDTLSRISGDEFVILLENTTFETAKRVAQTIQSKLANPIQIQSHALSIGLSLGIAVYPHDGLTMSELLRKADERMYRAKDRTKASLSERAK